MAQMVILVIMVAMDILVVMVVLIVIIMAVTVVIVIMATRTHRTTSTHGTDSTEVREDRKDTQICHLNFTFKVTCVGQLSQFLRCFTPSLISWQPASNILRSSIKPFKIGYFHVLPFSGGYWKDLHRAAEADDRLRQQNVPGIHWEGNNNNITITIRSSKDE